MNAYKIPIINNCQTDGCPRMATHEVRRKSSPNLGYGDAMKMIPQQVIGRYCEQCADALIEKLNAESVAQE